ncbi:FtsW/RodA/SpoVE family cell cycle protein [Pediococcus pentosaceus]|jgi:rod shape determining protein RodA|uniref:FtsW/RodA/SpoVE family cell cycle protein n=1 Tax=Pediococcus pentosaceus TaxID=1255 RepID=UPI000762A402|nr:FtsW/RodA/SpoVE family cell cycle protein [Pediococcus pentosaceus]MCQ9195943.1 rod shape-determining protein RodA [Pediococcus pentosaceus]MCQ9316086.1 rod shape-determining protein RodA [Pediococcus pentosaceus]MCQ9338233.1 rod shape-determining protein RodA [Pediococcus pentosaceus]MDN4854149.1 FtsW/RodA/SpoVE family cell cycle protein [Pediococcus pentosaceus]NEZ69802.1 rod shape-determining protein RodA [Pediococcus pentosaceus]
MERMNSRVARKDDSSRIDYGIIFPVLMLAIIGLASIYVAATHDTSATSILRQVVSQLVWYVLGIVIVTVIMQFDSKQLWKLAPIVYGIGLLLLVLVLFLYSRAYAANTGAKSWFALGPFTFQPSEVMKPAYILMMAKVITVYNSKVKERTVRSDWKLIGTMILWTLPVPILLLLQHDFGTMLVFIAIFAGLVVVSGVTWRILVPSFVGMVVLGSSTLMLVATSWGQSFLSKLGFESYQFARIDNWLHPASDTTNSGYQLWQSMKAIGSGQLFGKGFNVSNVKVPVRESDMIFSVIGENFGFVGSVVLIGLYFLLIYKIIQVIFDTKNEFYAYIAVGVIMMILFHVFENIGMNIGLLPLTGIPLPFVSAGGSALIGNMIGVGLIMSMRYHYYSYSKTGLEQKADF